MKPSLRFKILERDGFRCRYCGADASTATLHVDHLWPQSRGGDDSPGNLLTACWDCNIGKHSIALPYAALVRLITALRPSGRSRVRVRTVFIPADWDDLHNYRFFHYPASPMSEEERDYERRRKRRQEEEEELYLCTQCGEWADEELDAGVCYPCWETINDEEEVGDPFAGVVAV